MTANPLTHEENGYWSTDVSGAKLDDQYKFVLTRTFSNKPIWKNDPYARAMTNSVGNSIIAEAHYRLRMYFPFVLPSPVQVLRIAARARAGGRPRCRADWEGR